MQGLNISDLAKSKFKLCQRSPELTDYYTLLMLALLAGLAIAGKSFAYLGIPPLFITETTLAIGLIVLLRTRCLVGSLGTFPSLILAALLLWVAARTLPYLSRWGIDALRDSVLVVYGGFAFIVFALLLQKPSRLIGTIHFLRWFAKIYVFAGPTVMLLQFITNLSFLPGPDGSTLRAGELAVHLSACATLAILGFLPVRRPIWLGAIFVGIAIVASQNRGGLLAILVPVAIATPFSRFRWKIIALAGVGVIVLCIAYAADLGIPKSGATTSDNARELSVRQAVDNVTSIIFSGESEQDGTKEWRENWWRYIAGYTLHGRYFWTGKGFGINLAEDDGFVVGSLDAPTLRSPHSCHMNILARAGVPGLALWVLLVGSWLVTVAGAAVRAGRSGHTMWRNLFIFIMCYWLASIIDASFDVALEGPMIGVWFWCQTGFGLAAVSIYQAEMMERATSMRTMGRPLSPLFPVVTSASQRKGRLSDRDAS